MALCIHPTIDDIAVEVNGAEVDAVVAALPAAQRDQFELMFGYDGCRIAEDEVQYYLSRRPLAMAPQQYVDLVLQAC